MSRLFTEAVGQESEGIVTASTKPTFGDYQANGAMQAAKAMGTRPRELAEAVASKLDGSPYTSRVDVAGPGFINITLDDDFLVTHLARTIDIDPIQPAQTIVVDYSSPNIAKELHVGHMRSTVIGDSICRTMELAGHKVIRQNHVGDWGTSFGRLIAHLSDIGAEDKDSLSDLETLYVEATNRYNTDPVFAAEARRTVLALQNNDAKTREKWQRYVSVSERHMQDIYNALDITLKPEDIRGESAYNDELALVIEALQSAELLVESDGALCVFLEEFRTKENKPLPVLVQKSDGGYLYQTTDLATLRYRKREFQPDRILYFTDARQSLHFSSLFTIARKAQFVDESISLEHLPFGKILGKQGRPFSTREGTNILLKSLLAEGRDRALELVRQKNPKQSAQDQEEIANTIALGAIKYADLSKNRVQDYVFDWDVMLNFEGNTAPYLQYAYARIHSIFARDKRDIGDYVLKPTINHPAEHALAVQLLRFQETIEAVIRDAKPHYMCAYLYELTNRFMRFYEACPILTAGELRDSRLALCARCAETLELGFQCLGIRPLKRM